jgi:protein FAM50
MTDIKRIGDSGIHTVEGNVAGSRAAQLTKERNLQQAEYEAVKKQIKDDNSHEIGRIDSKFNVATDTLEQEFRRKTVGLVSADDFRKARELANAIPTAQNNEVELKKQIADKKLESDLKRKKTAATLSFSMDDDEEEEDVPIQIKKKSLKNPSVDTSYLPDAERDRELNDKKEALKLEWLQQQEVIKNEVCNKHCHFSHHSQSSLFLIIQKLEVVYSYWDGSGHRKEITVKKGMTIGKFLEAAKVRRSVANSKPLFFIHRQLHSFLTGPAGN